MEHNFPEGWHNKEGVVCRGRRRINRCKEITVARKGRLKSGSDKWRGKNWCRWKRVSRLAPEAAAPGRRRRAHFRMNDWQAGSPGSTFNYDWQVGSRSSLLIAAKIILFMVKNQVYFFDSRCSYAVLSFTYLSAVATSPTGSSFHGSPTTSAGHLKNLHLTAST